MDNRFQFPITEVDFNVVGLTGQAHDNYAEPGTLPRYDWMRSIVLGLLANQASLTEPSQFRPGTIHFDLNTLLYKSIQSGQTFGDLSKCIETIGESLYDWSQDIEEKRAAFQSSGTFSGVAHDATDVINLPENLQAIATGLNKPYLFKNGKIVDPSLLQFNEGCPVCIELSGDAVLEADDTFTVFIKR